MENLKTTYVSKLITALLFFFMVSWAHSQQLKDSLSLQNVLSIVLDKNPILRQAAGKIEIAHSEIGKAKSNRYPKLMVEGSFTYVDPISKVNLPIGEQPIELPLFPNDNWNVYTGLEYVLYDFGRTSEAINISKIQKLISEEGMEAAQKKVTYAATELFYTILFSERAIKVQDKLITSLQRNLKRINGLITNGLATNFDRVNTKVRITTAQNKKVSLNNSLNHLKHKLAELMGADTSKPDFQLFIKGDFELGPLNIGNNELDNSHRNDLSIAKHIDSILLSGQKLANKANFPFITIGGSTGFHNGYMPDLDDLRFNYAAFAKVTLPIFQGFKAKHERQIARIRYNNNKWHIKEVEVKVHAEFEAAKESLQNAYEQLDNNKILIHQAEIAVDQARKKYENQLITNLDLLDTEVVLAGAELSLLESKYKCIIAQYKIKQTMGMKVW